MKRKIYLHLTDYRDSFNEPHKKKPYYLFVSFSEDICIYFSNKRQAKKWLVSFENKVTEYYYELLEHCSNVATLNCVLTPYLKRGDLKKARDSTDFYLDRTHSLFFSSSYIKYEIGDEMFGFYQKIHNHYQFYLQFLRSNNRFNHLYSKTRQDFRNLKRLKNDIDILFSDVSGLKTIEIKENKDNLSEYFLKIA